MRDAVVGESVIPSRELFPREDEALVVGEYAHFILNLRLDGVDGVGLINLEGDELGRQGLRLTVTYRELHRDLHATNAGESLHEADSGIARHATIFQIVGEGVVIVGRSRLVGVGEVAIVLVVDDEALDVDRGQAVLLDLADNFCCHDSNGIGRGDLDSGRQISRPAPAVREPDGESEGILDANLASLRFAHRCAVFRDGHRRLSSRNAAGLKQPALTCEVGFRRGF